MQRFDGFAIRRFRVLPFQTEQHWLRGAVDIGVEYADTRAFAGQSQGQIDGGGGFANPALARGNRNNVFDTWYRCRTAQAGMAGHMVADFGDHLTDAGHLGQGGFDFALHAGQLALCRIGQHHIQADRIAIQFEVFHAFAAQVIAAGVRVKQLPQGVVDAGFVDGHIRLRHSVRYRYRRVHQDHWTHRRPRPYRG